MRLARRLKKLATWRKIRKAIGKRVQRAAPSLPRSGSDGSGAGEVEFLRDSVTEEHTTALRGVIDRVTGSDGIAGWAIDVTSPGRRLKLELVADGVVISAVETALYRDEVGFRHLPETTPGFRFSPSALLPLLEPAAAERAKDVAIRIAGTAQHLRGPSSDLTKRVYAAAEAFAASAPEAVYLDPLEFSLHLQNRRLLANALLARPFRPQSGTFDGYVEIAAPLSSDTVMIVGWLHQPTSIDFSGVIVAGRKYPSGFSGITFARSDIKQPAVGFVAFVRTDWRPAPGTDLTVYWGCGIPRYLRGISNIRILSCIEAGHWIATLDGQAAVRAYGEFQRTLSQLDTWVPSEGALREAGISYSVESIVVVPGFGSIAVGWVLTPYKRLHQMALRLGTHVCAGDRQHLSRVPRPDLAAGTGAVSDSIAGAGFRCVLRGSVKERDIHQPLLRLYFEDGSSYTLSVPRQTIRLCDGSAAIARLAHTFPSLANEPFLEEFTEAFAVEARQRAGESVRIVVAPAERVVLMTLPPNADDLSLAMAEIRRNASLLPADVGLAFLTTPQISRARLLNRFHDLKLLTGRPLSLFETSDPTYALWSIAPMLSALQADQFWFCGPDVVPTRNGWRMAASIFSQENSDLTLFLRASGAAPEPDSLSFSWSAAAFRHWIASAPFFLSGFYRDNRLPTQPSRTRLEGAIGLLHTMIGPEPIRRADERLYRGDSVAALGETLAAPRSVA